MGLLCRHSTVLLDFSYEAPDELSLSLTSRIRTLQSSYEAEPIPSTGRLRQDLVSIVRHSPVHHPEVESCGEIATGEELKAFVCSNGIKSWVRYGGSLC